MNRLPLSQWKHWPNLNSDITVNLKSFEVRWLFTKLNVVYRITGNVFCIFGKLFGVRVQIYQKNIKVISSPMCANSPLLKCADISYIVPFWKGPTMSIITVTRMIWCRIILERSQRKFMVLILQVKLTESIIIMCIRVWTIPMVLCLYILKCLFYFWVANMSNS